MYGVFVAEISDHNILFVTVHPSYRQCSNKILFPFSQRLARAQRKFLIAKPLKKLTVQKERRKS